MPPTDQITSNDPWFLRLMKKAGVTSKKTANLITIVIASVFLLITAFMYMDMLGGSSSAEPNVAEDALIEEV